MISPINTSEFLIVPSSEYEELCKLANDSQSRFVDEIFNMNGAAFL